MFRKAEEKDLDAICGIYDAIHTEEEAGRTTTGWRREIYPTEATARRGIGEGDMFVLEEKGKIAACGRINREQVPCYANGSWRYAAEDRQVMVLHTLVVDPAMSRMGFGSMFLQAYEAYAQQHGCPYLRLDTNEKNVRARGFYAKHGYWEAGLEPCEFNGIPGVKLVLLEKKI